jgi:hypothetical protein
VPLGARGGAAVGAMVVGVVVRGRASRRRDWTRNRDAETGAFAAARGSTHRARGRAWRPGSRGPGRAPGGARDPSGMSGGLHAAPSRATRRAGAGASGPPHRRGPGLAAAPRAPPAPIPGPPWALRPCPTPGARLPARHARQHWADVRWQLRPVPAVPAACRRHGRPAPAMAHASAIPPRPVRGAGAGLPPARRPSLRCDFGAACLRSRCK